MISHTLTHSEIHKIPAGRIMDMLIEEYILDDKPTRWSNSYQQEMDCKWFQPHPRTCAEDDGDYCCMDGVENWSTNEKLMFALSQAPTLADMGLSIRRIPDHDDCSINVPRFEATFASFNLSEVRNREENIMIGTAETGPLAVCRAALLVGSVRR